MRWGVAVSQQSDLSTALEEASGALVDSLGSAPELLLVFVTSPHVPQAGFVPMLMRQRFGSIALAGTTASGVLGGGQEVEEGHAVTLIGAVLPDVGKKVIHVDVDELIAVNPDGAHWRARLGVDPDLEPVFLLFGDSFTTPVEAFGAALDAAYPRAPKLGGLASGAARPGKTRLFADGRVHDAGVTIVALWGDIQVEPLIAHGCRPIGERHQVSTAQIDIVRELDGESAREVLTNTWNGLSDVDKELFRRSPHIGLRPRDAGDPKPATGYSGEFLVRNILGLGDDGSVKIGDEVSEGQTVQFHLRDPRSASIDLRMQSDRAARNGPVAAALLFTCIGRGQRFYGRPNHDSDAIRAAFGDIPIGGFFCNGEVGPVHQRTRLHGYTSVVALVRSRSWD